MDENTKNKLGVKEDKPNDWFETLYSNSNQEGEGVPWANMAPHPFFKDWIDKYPLDGQGKKALVIGCGMGDDSIELESHGFEVTAFDVSESAIELCKKRFPQSKVEFVQADLIQGVPAWKHRFDFVLEIFTIQALPPKYEKTLIGNISDFVAEQGKLVVITEIRKEERSYENGPPWLLNYEYIKSFEGHGLKLIEQTKNLEAEMGEEIHLSIFQKN
ncbi:class I SAM-dependent methyltransferase [Aureibacter tunicatorum]|uniref:Cyclopropane fatty-acyl-phospholipid synthase-like methyltransferase n=1 Tax=Aureibacter tunicatorum TaxID=866807 RepID=A0AAE3XKU5_9BACT|nr:class I SAM-dependent methyltransferase [Aureibacter tunicatorum]MDR6238458.1 cyclopropane fatty-acyl-phospholipid synthase-like methyltransferase [Aureibacter tunicatorum]BDD05608.1 hypothetical protein AUTU_30910 [Aureibacter tunicatorum]